VGFLKKQSFTNNQLDDCCSTSSDPSLVVSDSVMYSHAFLSVTLFSDLTSLGLLTSSLGFNGLVKLTNYPSH